MELFSTLIIPFYSKQSITLSRIDFFYELRKAVNRAEAITQESVMATGRLRERDGEIQILKAEVEKVYFHS